MNEMQKDIAQKALCEWLSEQEEMGKKPPKKIEFAFALKDDQNNDRIFFVFKFKKGAVGKYLIGIAGGFENEESTEISSVFSGFDEFPDDRDEAVELAFRMIDFILQFDARKKLQAAFERNLKYICANELDAEKIARQFIKSITRFFLTVGQVDVPSGRVVVADPLCYMFGDHVTAPVLKREIPKGTYPAEIALFRNKLTGIRICTARLKIKDTEAVRYELAESVEETAAAKFKDGVMHGFPVDAGMMCFCDSEGAKDYRTFLGNWHKNNPDKNHYDDYFAAFFAESAKNLPQFQREDGDFIEWTNPENSQRLVMIASGLGDGFYQSFWGFDDKGEICELTVPMVDPDIFEE
ncbi:MAG: DUF4241 domain-containing protein [Oscillospiraceae bacterium]|nr:DUF4241 domain-containing protein [Oscillospiraceae bacterium]